MTANSRPRSANSPVSCCARNASRADRDKKADDDSPAHPLCRACFRAVFAGLFWEKISMTLKAFAAAAALVALPFSAARADEGMWTFDAFPTAKMRADYGWAPDQVWLDKV